MMPRDASEIVYSLSILGSMFVFGFVVGAFTVAIVG